ncbi:hypothetical protein K420107F6_23530 [Lactonifactor longoviformis]
MEAVSEEEASEAAEVPQEEAVLRGEEAHPDVFKEKSPGCRTLVHGNTAMGAEVTHIRPHLLYKRRRASTLWILAYEKEKVLR